MPCCICGHFISTNVYWIPKVQGVLEIQKDKTRPFSPLYFRAPSKPPRARVYLLEPREGKERLSRAGMGRHQGRSETSLQGSATPGPLGSAPRAWGRAKREPRSGCWLCSRHIWGLWARPWGQKKGPWSLPALKPTLGALTARQHPQQVGKVRQVLRSAGGRGQPGTRLHRRRTGARVWI